MPVGFVVSGRNLEVILTGSFTPREVEAAIASGLRSSQGKPMRLLVEMRDPAFIPTTEQVLVGADVLKSLHAQLAAHCAFVVPNDVFLDAVNQIGHHVAPLGFEIGTFGDFESAKLWLDQMEPGINDP